MNEELLKNEYTYMEDSVYRGIGERTSAIMWTNSFHNKLSSERHAFIQDLTKHHQKERAAALISSSTLKHLSVNRDL